MTEIEELRARLAALEAKLNPPEAKPEAPKWTPPVIDHTAHFAPVIKPRASEYRTGQTPEEARMEFSKNCNPVGTLRPLSEFLSGKPAEDPPPAQPVTVPVGPPPGIQYLDRIVETFDALDRRDLERRFAGLPKVE